jgi:mono/diheme cytochrome c family protein
MGHQGHWFSIVFLSGVAALAVACSGGPAPQSASNEPVKVNLEEIFPPGAGRDLVLDNCQNCHTFVPIVVLQMDKDAWHRNSLDHRERVTTLTDEQFKTVYDYLSTNFGPDRPVPKLPKELLKTWTGY